VTCFPLGKSLWLCYNPAASPEVILAEHKYTAEMIGEALREAGTLVIVFTPLYAIFEQHKPGWSILMVLLAFGIGSMLLGIELEKRRRM
jgi:hypothetical protein